MTAGGTFTTHANLICKVPDLDFPHVLNGSGQTSVTHRVRARSRKIMYVNGLPNLQSTRSVNYHFKWIGVCRKEKNRGEIRSGTCPMKETAHLQFEQS